MFLLIFYAKAYIIRLKKPIKFRRGGHWPPAKVQVFVGAAIGRPPARKVCIMKLIIGNDHAGYELKCAFASHLEARPDINLIDIGTHSDERVSYPLYAAKVAGAVASGEADRGILICGTGIGVSIVANKYKGVRATLCTNSFMANMARAHNNSNVLCIGGRITERADALEILDAWLDTPYEAGRHEVSLGMICQVENGETLETDA